MNASDGRMARRQPSAAWGIGTVRREGCRLNARAFKGRDLLGNDALWLSDGEQSAWRGGRARALRGRDGAGWTADGLVRGRARCGRDAGGLGAGGALRPRGGTRG